MGKYYADDSEQRKEYFEKQFFSLAGQLARGQGISLSQFFKDLKNFTTFKHYLEAVFSTDGSLASYQAGMDNNEMRTFFERSKVQDIVEANKEEAEEEIDKIQTPILVQQVEKKTRVYFNAKSKGKRTRGYEVRFKVKGKMVTRLRDARGRFVSKI